MLGLEPGVRELLARDVRPVARHDHLLPGDGLVARGNLPGELQSCSRRSQLAYVAETCELMDQAWPEAPIAEATEPVGLTNASTQVPEAVAC
jgi:hypothetical protein